MHIEYCAINNTTNYDFSVSRCYRKELFSKFQKRMDSR